MFDMLAERRRQISTTVTAESRLVENLDDATP